MRHRIVTQSSSLKLIEKLQKRCGKCIESNGRNFDAVSRALRKQDLSNESALSL